jgi:hypothetical protein
MAFGRDNKEITMPAHGHTTVWGTHIGVGRAKDATSWYDQLKAWWATQKAMRREAQLTVKPLRADAAADMVAPAHARSTAMALCDLAF